MNTIPSTIDFPTKENDMAKLNERVPIDTFFPENEADLLSHQESFNKHLFRPNTYLHKWWARRAGTTFRYILKQLVPDANFQDYYTSGGLEGVTILDPMMGGGTTLHEAIRLGANVIGFDIDPIPVLQAKTSLANIETQDKIKVFDKFFNTLRARISHYFITKCPICSHKSEIQYTLYGIRKKREGKEIIVIDSFLLKEINNGNNIYLTEFINHKKISIKNHDWDIIDREHAKKLKINGKEHDILDIPFSRRYIPLLIVGYCEQHGQFYKPLDEEDINLLEKVEKNLGSFKLPDDGLFKIFPGPKSKDLLIRNIKSYHHLFTPRQLFFLHNSKEIIKSIPDEHKAWLSLLISTSLEFNSVLCGYKGVDKRRPGAIRHVFSHHAYSFPYTSLENNPVFLKNTSGTLHRLFNSRILTASKWAHAPIERYKKHGKWFKFTLLNESDIGNECKSIDNFTNKTKMFIVGQKDSSNLSLPDQSIDFVVTDPPYYDSVQYSDLSNFFRCWLQWLLPTNAEWSYITDKSAVAESMKGGKKYGETLSKIWAECNRVLIRPYGRLIFTYHHWNPNAWAELSISLKRSGFRLLNYFIVHSENPISVHIKNLKSLKHDSILVFQPIGGRDAKFWDEVNYVDVSDSRSFCSDCSRLLGWILFKDYPEDEIYEIWKNKITV